MFQLAWGRKVTNEFRQQILDICRTFRWSEDHASWLMSCIAFESAETFSPSVKNGAGSGAVGLIQFMPSTAEYLGSNSIELSEMTAVEQLLYVKRYFAPYHTRIKTLSDMYMAILMPKYVGAFDEVQIIKPGIQYRQNSGLDANRDGKITKAEASQKVAAKLVRGLVFATEEASLYP